MAAEFEIRPSKADFLAKDLDKDVRKAMNFKLHAGNYTYSIDMLKVSRVVL